MPKSSKKPKPVPRHFKDVAEAADFWDNHDLTDYWDLTREADFAVDIQRRVFLTALERFPIGCSSVFRPRPAGRNPASGRQRA